MTHNEAAEIRAGERPHKKIRHFDRLPYHFYGEAMSKTAAENSAEYWRNRGYLVRTEKEPGHNEWLLYRRKKTARKPVRK